jgi:ATP-dependent DNA helicase RecG
MSSDLDDIVRRLRDQGGDTTNLEAKSAAGGLPTTLTESLCALANLPGGGMVILGLDEASGFTPVGLRNPQALKQGLAGKARACMPPVQLRFLEGDDALVEGLPVVAAHVAECPLSMKPCRITATNRGWVRGWDGDYMMSELEEQAFLGQRLQPDHDRQVVAGASMEDLDAELLALWSKTAQEVDAGGLGRFDGVELLVKGGVVTPEGVPTVAGLLALGRQPQQFFPRFVVNLAAAPAAASSDVRARNATTVSGPIPAMLDGALEWARRTFDRLTVTDDAGVVRDRYQYPLDAFRELIGNALVHRDLAEWSAGKAVEVRLLPDRLVVSNPGGLYGITVDRLGRAGTTSARNARLLEICRYTRSADGGRVVETLATGIPRVLAALEADGLPAPRFQDAGIGFTVLLRSPEPAAVGHRVPPRYVLGLTGNESVVARALEDGPRTVASLEEALDMRGPNIRKVLRRLMERDLVIQDGGRGKPTTYRLNPHGPRIYHSSGRPPWQGDGEM